MNNYFYHNDCDGIVSAAAFITAFPEAFNACDYVLTPCYSSRRGGNFERSLKGVDNIYIFDYQYDPRAKVWIDHHRCEDMGDDVIITPSVFYDYRSRSCVALVDKYLRAFSDSGISEDTVRVMNMIDSASYPDVDFIFNNMHPLMVMRAFLEIAYPTEHVYGRLVEALVRTRMDIGKALNMLDIDKSYVSRVRNKAHGVGDKLEVFGQISILRMHVMQSIPRYAEALVARTKYSVRICGAGGGSSTNDKRVTISYNPWFGKPNIIDLRNFCVKHRSAKTAGGHFNIGVITMPAQAVESFLDDLSLTLGE